MRSEIDQRLQRSLPVIVVGVSVEVTTGAAVVVVGPSLVVDSSSAAK